MTNERIRCAARLDSQITGAEEAAQMIQDGMTVGVSGFTPSGCPKVVTAALARQVTEDGRKVRINVLSGASTGGEIDALLGNAGVINHRAPYITSGDFRKVVNSGGALLSGRSSGHDGPECALRPVRENRCGAD